MTHLQEPTADSIRVAYVPFDEPIVHRTVLLDGLEHELLTRGTVRAEWDSPEGVFTYAQVSREELDDEALDEMRPLLAEALWAAYKQERSR